MQPARLKGRIISWAEMEIKHTNHPRKSGQLLEAVLYRGGELPRGEAAKYLMQGSVRRAELWQCFCGVEF
jgi:hypothetical protein